MDFNRMTERLQTALLSAQSIAVRENHQEVDEVHLYLAFIDDSSNLVYSILEKLHVNKDSFRRELEQLLGKKPRVTGSGVEQGKLYITNQLQKLLAEAEKTMKSFRDEYISVEHVLISSVSLNTDIGSILRKMGISLQHVLEAVKDIRGNQRVTSPNPEGTYEALKIWPGLSGRSPLRKNRSGHRPGQRDPASDPDFIKKTKTIRTHR